MNYYLTLALLLFLYMSLWFIIALTKKRNDVADVAWGLGFVIMTWASFYLANSNGSRQLIVCFLVSIWGLRLAWHIHQRNKGKPEDYRYQKWRTDWGKWFYLRSYFQVYILQGVLLSIIVLPVLMINKNTEGPLGILDFIGAAVWLFGFYFETVGDAQLTQFLKNPQNKGKLMQSGLWAYTRHPNYFGEVTQWWGIWLIALSIPNGIFGIISPLTITFLILKVSGIPMLEKKMAEHLEFEEYKRKTSMFIPLPRKLL